MVQNDIARTVNEIISSRILANRGEEGTFGQVANLGGACGNPVNGDLAHGRPAGQNCSVILE